MRFLTTKLPLASIQFLLLRNIILNSILIQYIFGVFFSLFCVVVESSRVVGRERDEVDEGINRHDALLFFIPSFCISKVGPLKFQTIKRISTSVPPLRFSLSSLVFYVKDLSSPAHSLIYVSLPLFTFLLS